MYCYLIFKRRCLKTWKNWFNYSKRIIWACSFCEKKGDGFFGLFKSIFLRNQSLSRPNAMWFYGKNAKLEREICILTENRSNRNEMWCAADSHNYMCHMHKDFQKKKKKKNVIITIGIRRRSDYIIRFVTPAIGPNKSTKLTRLTALTHNREYPLLWCMIANKRGHSRIVFLIQSI